MINDEIRYILLNEGFNIQQIYNIIKCIHIYKKMNQLTYKQLLKYV